MSSPQGHGAERPTNIVESGACPLDRSKRRTRAPPPGRGHEARTGDGNSQKQNPRGDEDQASESGSKDTNVSGARSNETSTPQATGAQNDEHVVAEHHQVKVAPGATANNETQLRTEARMQRDPHGDKHEHDEDHKRGTGSRRHRAETPSVARSADARKPSRELQSTQVRKDT